MAGTTSSLKRVSISLTPEEYEALHAIASRHKTTVSGLVRELAQELLEDLKDSLNAAED